MSWLIKTLTMSVGKKLIMAATGLFFCIFLVIHLIGNLTLYGGKDMFNSYASHLNALGPLIRVAEIGLLIFAVIHVATGLTLAYQNYSARPEKYQMNKSGGGRTIGSSTMPYTGTILILFIIVHLAGFRFADLEGKTLFDIVFRAFHSPAVVCFYVSAMLVAAVHVSHGFWSAFQTLGINHDKYTPSIRKLSILFSIVVGAGFGIIPIWLLMSK